MSDVFQGDRVTGSAGVSYNLGYNRVMAGCDCSRCGIRVV